MAVMKVYNLIISSLIILLAIPTASFSIDDKINNMLTSSASKVGVKLDQSAKEYLQSEYSNVRGLIRQKLVSLDPKQLEKSLQSYFLVTKNSVGSNILKAEDISDFRWEFMAEVIGFIPVKWETDEPVRIESLNSCGRIIELHSAIIHRRAEKNSISIPAIECDFTLYGKVKDKSVIWTTTWEPVITPIFFPVLPFIYRKECEIHVNSKPNGADVYFNEKKHYRTTNTKSARKSGEWRIKIVKKGYEDWVRKRNVKQSEIWLINASLLKKSP
jgi:hypothetical protein